MTAPSFRPSDAAAGEMTVDIAVVGGGPAGIAASVAAAGAGRSVALLDEGITPGGQIWRQGVGSRLPRQASRWLARLESSSVTRLHGTQVVDVRLDDANGGLFLVAERDGHGCLVRAERLVLATGARERLLPFPGWTLPGVFGLGGAQALLTAGMPVAGRRAVVAGSGPLLLPVASALARAGARVQMVAEQADMARVAGFATSLWRSPGLLLRAARYRSRFLSTPYATGSWVTAAEGDGMVQRVSIVRGGRTVRLPCDILCVGYGLVPGAELARLVGCEVARGAVLVDDTQRTSVDGVYCAGEPTGIGGVELSLVEGEMAGFAAAGDDARARSLLRSRERLRQMAARMERAFAPRAELRDMATSDTIVCRCEDVTRGMVSSCQSSRHARLQARAGMGPCQGRACGPALEFIFGWEPGAVRPPASPVLLSTILATTDPTVATPDEGVT